MRPQGPNCATRGHENEFGGGGLDAVRRNLKLATLDEVMPDVARLLVGHTTVGRWSLGQILHHLALATQIPVGGVPVKYPWPVRRLFGPVARRLSFWLGWIPEGFPMPDAYLPPPGLDATSQAEALRAAIERFEAFTGRPDEHPVLGCLSWTGWHRFHCLHCAHHLSFALPTPPGG